MTTRTRPPLLRIRPRTTGGRCGRCFSSSSSSSSSSSPYDETLQHLRIGRGTRVLFQGFTGRQATANAQESLAWGTQIVGGVTPGRSGAHLGLPLLPSVRAAVAALRPHATGIYVPAALAAAAIEEAVAAEVPLVVAVAEHIPLHAQLRLHALLRTQSRSRLVGANSPGLLSAVGRCRIGFQPLSVFSDGPGPEHARVGIAARSGTLSYEAAAAITRAGLGQSLCIGVGGDLLAGTTLPEALAVLAADPDTDAIALVGEIGGDSELQAAAWLAAYRRRRAQDHHDHHPKPVAALVAGTHAVPGRIMGHAGAVALPGDPSAAEKIRAFEAAGVTVVHHPEQFGTVLRDALAHGRRRPAAAAPSSASAPLPPSQQKRHMHAASVSAARHRPWRLLAAHRPQQPQQTRSIYLGDSTSAGLLRGKGVTVADDGRAAPAAPFYLAISVDRAARSPCVLAAPAVDVAAANPAVAARRPTDSFAAATRGIRRFPFPFGPADDDAIDDELVRRVAACLVPPGPHGDGRAAAPSALRRLLRALYAAFREQEAYLVEAAVAAVPAENPAGDAAAASAAAAAAADLVVVQARIALDDVAFAQRPAQDAAALLAAAEPPEAEEAEAQVQAEAQRAGIVYIPLTAADPDPDPDPDPAGPRIGTLVNGAGLAMNTVDALAARGGRAANFLDTGGKATSETVRACFALLQRDPRVRVVFVNVFGGLTRGDMIARGILLACGGGPDAADMALPVVVRLRGTNEAEGQALLQASGLPRLHAYDSFAEAAAKAIALAREDR